MDVIGSIAISVQAGKDRPRPLLTDIGNVRKLMERFPKPVSRQCLDAMIPMYLYILLDERGEIADANSGSDPHARLLERFLRDLQKF